MKKTIVLVLLLLALAGCPEPEPDNPLTESEWTIMVFLDADNNLEPASVMDIEEMEQIGSSDKVKIVLQWDRIEGFDESNGNWTGTKRFLVKKHPEEGIGSEELKDLGELDMADSQTLTDFIEWTKKEFPAKKYALILWDHGGGWTMHTEDSTSGNSSNLKKLTKALAESKTKLDLIMFDQCLMSQIDVAYAIKDYSKVMIASEDIIPFFSINYSSVLEKLEEKPEINEKELAKIIVESYGKYYSEEFFDPFTTMTAINLEEIDSVVFALNEFTEVLGKELEENWPAIGESLYFSESFATPEGLAVVKSFSTYDLADFSELVRQKIDSQELNKKAVNLENAIQKAVITEYHGEQHPYAKGLTMYFPEDETIYLENYSETDFAEKTGWNKFIKKYIETEKTDVIIPSLEITEVSSSTTSIYNPIRIQGTATGNNLISIFRVVGRVYQDKIYMLNNHNLIQTYQEYEGDRNLPQFFDGVNTIDHTWVPTASYITNGADSIIAPLQPFGKGDNYFAVQGEYIKGSQIFDAILVFDFRTGLLLNALEIIETENGITQKEFLIEKEGVFSPYMEYYDTFLGEYSYMKTDSIQITENGLGIDQFLLPEGEYVIGLFVSDLTGNVVTDIASVEVKGQPAPNFGISAQNIIGNWVGESIGFEIKEDESCVFRTKTREDSCMYWFRNNNGLPLLSFYIQADNDIIYVNFMVEATENKLTLTEMFEGGKEILWKDGIQQQEKEVDKQIIGKWTGLGQVEFKANKSYLWEINEQTITGTFFTENGILYLDSQGIKSQYSYSVSTNNLTITDSQGTTTFTKFTETTNPLVGAWYNSAVNETVYFFEDLSYQSLMSGTIFVTGTYSIKGNTLILSSAYGVYNYGFEINGITLTLYDSVYGTKVSYKKLV